MTIVLVTTNSAMPTGASEYSTFLEGECTERLGELHVVRCNSVHRALYLLRLARFSSMAAKPGLPELGLPESVSGILVDHLRSWRVAAEVEAIVRRRGQRPWLGYLSHNYESGRGFGNGRMERMNHRRLVSEEQRLLDRALFATAISSSDAAHLNESNRRLNVGVLHPGVGAIAGTASSGTGVLWLTSLLWRQRVGLVRQVLNDWCDVIRSRTETLTIAGWMTEGVATGLRREIARLGLADVVTIEASPKDLESLAAQHAAGLVYEPLGGGFQLKILEYLRLGLVPISVHGANHGTQHFDRIGVLADSVGTLLSLDSSMARRDLASCVASLRLDAEAQMKAYPVNATRLLAEGRS